MGVSALICTMHLMPKPEGWVQVLGMDLLKSGFYSVLPWITMAISSNFAGYLADTLIQRGTSVTLVRKVMQTVCSHGR